MVKGQRNWGPRREKGTQKNIHLRFIYMLRHRYVNKRMIHGIPSLIFPHHHTHLPSTLHEDLCSFMVISRWIHLRMKNFPSIIYVENQNTHFVFNIFFFGKSCLIWDNVEKYGTVRGTTRDNVILHRKDVISMLHNKGKNTDTYSYYLIILLHNWLILFIS